MIEIAVLAGFGSLRRFNAVFADVYGRAPNEIRRARSRAQPDSSGADRSERLDRCENCGLSDPFKGDREGSAP
jgi:AraC-like DNA-binding protein